MFDFISCTVERGVDVMLRQRFAFLRLQIALVEETVSACVGGAH